MQCPGCHAELSATATAKFCGICGCTISNSMPLSTQSVNLGTQAYFPAGAAGTDYGSEQARLSATDSRSASGHAGIRLGDSLYSEAIRNTFSWKPVSLVALGLFACITMIFGAFLIAGIAGAATARNSGFSDAAAAALIIGLFASLLIYVTVMLFAGAASKMCYEQVVNNVRLGRRASLQFAFDNIGALLAAPVLLGLIVGGLLFGEWILFLSGSIEFIGPIFTGTIFAPMIILNIALFLGLFYGIWLMLLTVASESTGAGETISRTWRIVRISYKSFIPDLVGLTIGQLLLIAIGTVMLLFGYFQTMAVRMLGSVAGMISMDPAQMTQELMRSGSYIGSSANTAGVILGAVASVLGMALIQGLAWSVPQVFFLCGCSRIYCRAKQELASAASV